MHGAIFLTMKTEGPTHQTVRRWIGPAVFVFICFFTLSTISTWLHAPHMVARFKEMPYLVVFPILAFAAIANIFYQVKKKNDGWAFVSSCLCLALLLILYGFGTYPVIVPSTIDPLTNSLTIYNAASTHKTLMNLLVIVIIGVPLVLAYGFWVYRIFRGKVQLNKMSY